MPVSPKTITFGVSRSLGRSTGFVDAVASLVRFGDESSLVSDRFLCNMCEVFLDGYVEEGKGTFRAVNPPSAFYNVGTECCGSP